MSWKSNALMWWRDNSGNFQKVSDHNRSPLDEGVERIESKSRMADGTLRRYVVAQKRTWSMSWSMLPSTNDIPEMATVDGGLSGEQLEEWSKMPDAFRMVMRRGSAINKPIPQVPEDALPYSDDDFYITNMMITDFNKSVEKRGRVDFWNVDITLEEV